MKDYKKILEGVVDIINTTEKSDIGFANICTYMGEKCPELKDGEDDRIRKIVYGWINAQPQCFFDLKDISKEGMIAWLEKQGEETEEKKKIRDDIANFIFTSHEDIKNRAIWLDYLGYKPIFKEEQREKKPADKVEPKFNVGEWIVWQDKCYKVNDNGCGYELVDQNGLSTSLEYGTIDKNAHLWDITKDAKAGDVLAKNDVICIFRRMKLYHYNLFDSYCELYTECKPSLGFGFDFNIHNFYPATAEEKELLFQKIKKKGYVWDGEKLELKKIEQKSAESKINSDLKDLVEKEANTIWKEISNGGECSILTCSQFFGICRQVAEAIVEYRKPAELGDDDNKMIDNIVEDLYAHTSCSAEFDRTTLKKINWLKSLKERYTWKPNDE